MNRSLATGLIVAMAVALIASESAAQSKRQVSFAFTNEITYEPYVYAIRKGIVTSNSVEVKLLPTAIPALLQATGTKQFDLIETSPLGLAQGISRGLDARVAGTAGIVRGGRFVFVKKDLPIKDPGELKGKSMGVTAIASTLVAHIRAVLAKQQHFNVSLENGDIRWVDLPMPTLPSALERGQVDSAYLIHIPSLKNSQLPRIPGPYRYDKEFSQRIWGRSDNIGGGHLRFQDRGDGPGPARGGIDVAGLRRLRKEPYRGGSRSGRERRKHKP